MGSAWFDLAGVLAGDELSEAASQALLRAYLGCEPQPQHLYPLALFDCLYRYLELLWYAQHENSVDADFRQRKLDRLQQRLRELPR
jgi:hypothetical protein